MAIFAWISFDCPGGVRYSYFMTTSLSSKGQIVIPRAIREKQKLQSGEDFLIFELSNGDILLRRVRRSKKSLVWHLRQFRGVEIIRNKEKVREFDW